MEGEQEARRVRRRCCHRGFASSAWLGARPRSGPAGVQAGPDIWRQGAVHRGRCGRSGRRRRIRVGLRAAHQPASFCSNGSGAVGVRTVRIGRRSATHDAHAGSTNHRFDAGRQPAAVTGAGRIGAASLRPKAIRDAARWAKFARCRVGADSAAAADSKGGAPVAARRTGAVALLGRGHRFERPRHDRRPCARINAIGRHASGSESMATLGQGFEQDDGHTASRLRRRHGFDPGVAACRR